MWAAWAYAVVILLGVYALFWLWQIKDLALPWIGLGSYSVDPTQPLQPTRLLEPGDHVSFEGTSNA